VTVFAPIKRLWREELVKEECMKKNLRHSTIPKDR
jgi:hypothetical protein